MEPVTLSIVGWLVEPAASALFEGAKEYLLQRLGLSSPPPETPPLLDKYLGDLQRLREDLRRLRQRIDEDRIAKLYGAFSKLKDAPQSAVMQGLLVEALDNFHEIAQIPQEGMTGERTNAELRSMAFIGMAASYHLLHSQSDLVADKMIQAVEADAAIAKQWLGESLVTQIKLRMEVSCPECGHRNPPESRFCNQDGYPLIPGLRASSPADKEISWCPIRELLAKPQFSKFAHLAQYYYTGYKERLAWALAPGSNVIQVEVPFSRDFANVALALFTAEDESPTTGNWVALYDILRGFMLQVRVYPEYKLGSLSYQSPQGATIFYFVEEVAPLKIMITGIFRGGKFGIGKKYLNDIVSRMEKQLNIKQAQKSSASPTAGF